MEDKNMYDSKLRIYLFIFYRKRTQKLYKPVFKLYVYVRYI